MPSIPSSPHRSISNIKDLQNLFENPLTSCLSRSPTPPLQFFNMRVTERLHRYRTLKRHWHEVAIATKQESSSPTRSDSRPSSTEVPVSTHELLVEPKLMDVKDYIPSITTIGAKDIIEKNPLEFRPPHSRIEEDLIKLRRYMKETQKKRFEMIPSKSSVTNQQSGEKSMTTLFEDQDTTTPVTYYNNNYMSNNGISSPLTKAKLFDRVKPSGSHLRPSTFPQSNLLDNKNVTTNYSSTTYSQHLKQRQKVKQKVSSKTFNVCRSRINVCVSPDTVVHRQNPTKKKSNTPPKTILSTSSKQSTPYRLPVPQLIKKTQSCVIKQDNLVPTIQPKPKIEQITTVPYTYAASTSSATPSSMKINRNKSLLPILLTPISCIGIQSQENFYENCDENNDEGYYNLLRYSQLTNHLPKPVISIRSHYNQDDYGILLEQLDHIRETMPDSHVYDNFTRVC